MEKVCAFYMNSDRDFTNGDRHMISSEIIMFKRKVMEASKFIGKTIDGAPSIGISIGTGLGEMAGQIESSASIAYEEIPHFPVSTVQGHSGILLSGKLFDKNVIAMQGRFHLYEGYSPLEVTFPIRVMQELGVRTIIIANASGGLNPSFSSGDIMIIDDHINLTGSNPLVGYNIERWGIRFPHMIGAYNKKLAESAFGFGRENDIAVQKGVYAGLKGPSLETPAEVRFLQTIGADAVGFSTVMEVIAAVHAQMKILGLSVITNVCVPPSPATVEEVITAAKTAAPKLERIIGKMVEEIDET